MEHYIVLVNQPPPMEEKPQLEGNDTWGGNQTKQLTPQPDANARLAQDPEPRPQKHLELLEDGKRPTGQEEEGKESQTLD